MTDATFEAEVLKSDVPVLVDFWAPWCGPCRMIAPLIDQLAEEYDGKLKAVRAAIPRSPRRASHVFRGFPRHLPTPMACQAISGVPLTPGPLASPSYRRVARASPRACQQKPPVVGADRIRTGATRLTRLISSTEELRVRQFFFLCVSFFFPVISPRPRVPRAGTDPPVPSFVLDIFLFVGEAQHRREPQRRD